MDPTLIGYARVSTGDQTFDLAAELSHDVWEQGCIRLGVVDTKSILYPR
jgi:predicted site-specific integrase-resolvase